MATRIFLRHGNGKPLLTDFDTANGRGELLVDLTDRKIWTVADPGGVPTVVELAASADLTGLTVDYDTQVTGKPTSFPPEEHYHDYTEVTVDGTDTGKTLASEIADIIADINRIDGEITALEGNLAFGGTAKASTGQITQVTAAGTAAGFTVGGIPSTPPVGSENIYFIIEDSGTVNGTLFSSGDWLVSEGAVNGWTAIHFDTASVLWDDIAGKPDSFNPAPHTHAISEVTGLQTALDGKADDGHTHDFADISATGGTYDGMTLTEALDSKANIDIIQGGNY